MELLLSPFSTVLPMICSKDRGTCPNMPKTHKQPWLLYLQLHQIFKWQNRKHKERKRTGKWVIPYHQEPTETSKQPIRTRYLDHVTGYQPISDQYFLVSVGSCLPSSSACTISVSTLSSSVSPRSKHTPGEKREGYYYGEML
eukprot:sb/3474168/